MNTKLLLAIAAGAAVGYFLSNKLNTYPGFSHAYDAGMNLA